MGRGSLLYERLYQELGLQNLCHLQHRAPKSPQASRSSWPRERIEKIDMLFNHTNLKVTYVTSTHVALDKWPHPGTKRSRKCSWTMAEQPLLTTADS